MINFNNNSSIKFMVSNNPVPYTEALQTMQEIIKNIRYNNSDETIWFLEHPPMYTAGTSANDDDLINPNFPVFQSQRGGKHTYHGPGQLVVYVMVDLKKRGNDIRLFVRTLEEWIIQTLKVFGKIAVSKTGRIGVWIDDEKGERKIAAIGVRVTQGVTWHGLSLNINPDLSHYQGIIPCGLHQYKVTSLAEEGVVCSVSNVIEAMKMFKTSLFK